MSKAFARLLIISCALGLAACDSKSEQKAQDAQAHTETAQKKTEQAQAHLQQAEQQKAEAAKDQAAARDAAAEEAKTFVPTSETPQHLQTPEKK